MSVNLSIGGHVLSIVGEAEGSIIRHMPCFSPFLTQQPGKWSICFSNSFHTPIHTPIHQFKLENQTDCCLSSTPDGMLFSLNAGQPDALDMHFANNRVECCHCDNPSFLKFGLWMAYSLLGLPCNALPIHAAVVVVDGRAALFLGESGTGKSTHASLWINHIPGAMLLNDDSPILSIENNQAWVYGSPWSGKTPCYKPQRFPVQGIVRLQQAPFNRIRQLATPLSIVSLQPSLPPSLVHADSLQALLMEFISHVIKKTPIYQLDCLPDDKAAFLCHNTLFK